ncbi:MAG: hypothetical protein WA971_05055, partial [Microbacterium sp.]
MRVRMGALGRMVAAVTAAGMLATAFSAAAAAEGQTPPTVGAIEGAYAFSSLGSVEETWEHRNALSADGAKAAVAVDVLDPDTGLPGRTQLMLIDTATGERAPVAGGAAGSSCPAISGDGTMVAFRGDPTGTLPRPAGISGDWGYLYDMATDATVPFPVPDPALRGDAYDDRLCPLAMSQDGTRVAFTLWERVFVADFGAEGGSATPVLEGLGSDDVPQGTLSADGSRLLIDGRTYWDPDHGEMKDSVVIDLAGSTELWKTSVEKDVDVAMSRDGRSVAWLEPGAVLSAEDEIQRQEVVLAVRELASGAERRIVLGEEQELFNELPEHWYVLLTADGAGAYVSMHDTMRRVDIASGAEETVVDASRALEGVTCANEEDCFPLIADPVISDDGAAVAFLLTERGEYRQDVQ